MGQDTQELLLAGGPALTRPLIQHLCSCSFQPRLAAFALKATVLCFRTFQFVQLLLALGGAWALRNQLDCPEIARRRGQPFVEFRFFEQRSVRASVRATALVCALVSGKIYHRFQRLSGSQQIRNGAPKPNSELFVVWPIVQRGWSVRRHFLRCFTERTSQLDVTESGPWPTGTSEVEAHPCQSYFCTKSKSSLTAFHTDARDLGDIRFYCLFESTFSYLTTRTCAAASRSHDNVQPGRLASRYRMQAFNVERSSPTKAGQYRVWAEDPFLP